MQVCIVKKSDIDRLLVMIDRNPIYGSDGGSHLGNQTKEQLEAYEKAHSFFNYQVRKWVDQIQRTN